MRPRGHLGVFLLFLGLVSVYTWPLARDPAHLLPDNTDPRLFAWVMLTVFRNLVTRPELLLHGNAFYPLGNSLTFAEPLLTPALLAGPLFWLTGSPILAYNVTLLVFWAVSGWAMYAVTFWLTRQHPAAFIAALVFTLAPPRTEYAVEFQMEMAFGIPLAVYTLVRFFEAQRVRYLVAFVAIFWLQAVAVWYYGVILAFGLVAIALQYAALRWTGWRGRTVMTGGLGAGALLLALAPIAWPYFVTRRELGFARGLEDALDPSRSADVLAYLGARSTWLYRGLPFDYSAETSLFLGVGGLALAAVGLRWLARKGLPPRSRAERWLAAGLWGCLGLGILALATRGRIRVGPVRVFLSFSAVGVAFLVLDLARHAAEGWRRRREGAGDRRLGEREWVMLLSGLAAFAFLLSLGPVARLASRSLGTGLYAWLHPYVLPLHAIRGAARFGLLVLFAGALLAGFGVAGLARRLPRGAHRAVVAGFALLLLLEYASFPMTYLHEPGLLRPVDAVIRADPDDVVVLEWPANSPGTDTDATFRSIGHGKRVVNGFAGFVPELLRDLSATLSATGPGFPTAEAQEILRRLHPLRYLVVRLRDGALPEESRPLWEALRREAPPLLRFRGTFGDEDLYEVVPLPERGVRVERWVSYDFLRAHPVLTLALRPLASEADAEQWAEVRLNGRPIRRLPLDGDVRATVALSPPFLHAAPNVIELRHGYRRRAVAAESAYRIGGTGVVSPGDLWVESGGQPWGDAASVRLNGEELALNRRGYNLVALDPGGRGVTAEAFDTFEGPETSQRLAAWVGGLAAGTVVAGAVKDEGSRGLRGEAVAALRGLGVAGDLRGRYRESHAFIGVKGAAPGTAVEAGGPRPVRVEVGRLPVGLGLMLAGFALEPR